MVRQIQIIGGNAHMLLNRYRISIHYKEVTVYAHRYAIPTKTHIEELQEFLKTEFPHASNKFTVTRITTKKVDLSVIDLSDDKRVKRLKLQFVKHQIEKGLTQ